jgi:hypothetical protein
MVDPNKLDDVQRQSSFWRDFFVFMAFIIIVGGTAGFLIWYFAFNQQEKSTPTPTSTPTSTPSPCSEPEGRQLSGGEIAGIVIGSVFGFLLLWFFMYFYFVPWISRTIRDLGYDFDSNDFIERQRLKVMLAEPGREVHVLTTKIQGQTDKLVFLTKRQMKTFIKKAENSDTNFTIESYRTQRKKDISV